MGNRGHSRIDSCGHVKGANPAVSHPLVEILEQRRFLSAAPVVTALLDSRAADNASYLLAAVRGEPVETKISINDLHFTFTGKPQEAIAVVDVASNSISTPERPVVDYFTAGGEKLDGPPVLPGTYTVQASFAGNAQYGPSSGSAKLTILRGSATINVTANGGTETGKPFRATGKVIGLHGRFVATPEFTYYTVDDYRFAGPPLAGPPSSPGDYVVVAQYPGNDDYYPETEVKDFTITPAKTSSTTTLTAPGGTFNGKPFKATATVTSNGQTLPDPHVVIHYYDSDHHQLSGPPTQPGNYTTSATFVGDQMHNAGISNTINFTIAKATPEVSMLVRTDVPSGRPVKGNGVVTGVENKRLGTPTITYFTFSGTGPTSTIPKRLSGPPSAPGQYFAVATWPGNKDYNAGSITQTFIIKAP